VPPLPPAPAFPPLELDAFRASSTPSLPLHAAMSAAPYTM
jgi:hypothetical protein